MTAAFVRAAAPRRRRTDLSGRLVGEILRCAPEDLTDAELKVLIVLAENAWDHDRTARTPTVDIAWLARVSVGTAYNALSSLARRALIQPLHKASRGHAQDYRITPLSEHHRASRRGSKASLGAEPIDPESLTPQ